MVSETLSDFYFEHDIRTGNIFILADYYTDLVSSFRFVVIQKNLGEGGGGLRPTGCLEECFPQSPSVHAISINQLHMIIDY